MRFILEGMIVNTFSGQMIVLVDLSHLIFLQMLFDAFNVPFLKMGMSGGSSLDLEKISN